VSDPSSSPSPQAQPTPEPGRDGWLRGGGGWTTLVAAVVGALVAVVVTLGIQSLSKGSVPKVPLPGNSTTITEDTAAANVTQSAGPAVVSVLTGDPSATGASGFLVSGDGYVVTNVGVLANATRLMVELSNDPHLHDARLVDADCQTGLAVIKVDQVTGQSFLSFADSSSVKPGQNAILLGGAQPTRSTVTRAVVSGVAREVTATNLAPGSGDQQLTGLIQTDVAITPNLNGGPLLSSGGQVVGVLTQANAQGQVVGFALPANMLQPEVQQIQQNGHLLVPSLGVRAVQVTPEQAVLQGGTAGAKITAVTPGGPADKAGLKAGDVLTKLDDQTVSQSSPLPELLRAKFKPDQRVVVSYGRAGQPVAQVQLALIGEHPTCS
jgi:S1-C subfamily serine protease